MNSQDSQRQNFKGPHRKWADTRWNRSENLQYLIFLQHHIEKFQCKIKRTFRLFKPMSQFISSRTSEQCRSHHRKLLQKCKEPKAIIEHLESQYDVDEIKAKKEILSNKLNLIQVLKKKEPLETKKSKKQKLVIETERPNAQEIRKNSNRQEINEGQVDASVMRFGMMRQNVSGLQKSDFDSLHHGHSFLPFWTPNYVSWVDPGIFWCANGLFYPM